MVGRTLERTFWCAAISCSLPSLQTQSTGFRKPDCIFSAECLLFDAESTFVGVESSPSRLLESFSCALIWREFDVFYTSCGCAYRILGGPLCWYCCTRLAMISCSSRFWIFINCQTPLYLHRRWWNAAVCLQSFISTDWYSSALVYQVNFLIWCVAILLVLFCLHRHSSPEGRLTITWALGPFVSHKIEKQNVNNPKCAGICSTKEFLIF